MDVIIVIGKGFGDEGKGLTTDYFAARAQRNGRDCLVIRHNGGAQAGHTVDLPQARFVFHQLSSGSFRGADTLWSSTFLPDLYKLSEERESFAAAGGVPPRIFASESCRCVCIDDVLLNMALETSRGSNRHGSCGMGINEAVQRSRRKEFRLPLKKAAALTAEALFHEMKRIRAAYLPLRLAELRLSLANAGEYAELLGSEAVLRNAAEGMKRGLKHVTPAKEKIALRYGTVIFEGAQGLLLDENYKAFAPHLTTSRTGLDNPIAFLREHLPGEQAEAVYVTRSYVTRHGMGPLPHEDDPQSRFCRFPDPTNCPNKWQGTLRFAPHGSDKEFFAPLAQDSEKGGGKLRLSLMVTHLNETDGCLRTVSGDRKLKDWLRENRAHERFWRIYSSSSRFAEDIQIFETNKPECP